MSLGNQRQVFLQESSQDSFSENINDLFLDAQLINSWAYIHADYIFDHFYASASCTDLIPIDITKERIITVAIILVKIRFLTSTNSLYLGSILEGRQT